MGVSDPLNPDGKPKAPFGLKPEEIEPVSLDASQRFVGGKFNDFWAAILFVLHFVVTLALGGLGAYCWVANDTVYYEEATPTSEELYSIIGITFAGVIVGTVFAVVYLVMSMKAPRLLIQLSMIGFVLIFLAYAALWLVLGVIYGSIWAYITAAFLLLYVFLVAVMMFFVYRKTVHLTAAYITIAVGILNKFKGVLLVGALAVTLYLVMIVFWTVAFALLTQVYRASWGPYVFIPAAFWMIFSWYWCAQVVKGIVRTTVAGVVGRWYFDEATSSNGTVVKAFTRASVTSIGSICFGSLIVAILSTAKTFFRFLYAVNRGARPQNLAQCMIKCFVACLLACLTVLCLRLEIMMKYFNRYAFSFVAIYGMPYVKAGIATVKMLAYNGLEAVLNDMNLYFVMFTQMFAIGGVGALVATLCIFVAQAIAGYTFSGFTWFMAELLTIIAALGVGMLTTEIINYCLPAVLICSTDEPQRMKDKVPELYELLSGRYAGLRLLRDQAHHHT